MSTPEDPDLIGRRAQDRYPGPEAVGVILAQLTRDIAEVKGAVKEGFSEMRQQFGQFEQRLSAMERFRERVEERDRALAKSEGNLTVRLPIIALALTVLTIVVSVVIVLLTNPG